METLDNTLTTSQISILNTIIARVQSKILCIGYHLVFIKSKIKKRLKIISRIFFFNF